eukprot:CAMPEP_0197527816 /NCGR_PEP_ID=MMETSP1318-20131121/22838_1 /TAXON_ID=552666 /ORGANISM="Partenskyella glossopodia, Strain RCC365" /LENGTH=435 /DNA_ID=CAMNT_0043082637 /DNA_START=293 /DNA_END=1600 /DNA_ORIENTATION=+
MAVVPDIAGQLRGKGFPEEDKQSRFERGIGWCPTQMLITAFTEIAPTPYGALDDLQLVPDPDAEVRVESGNGHPPHHFVLANLVHPAGESWDLCLRTYLKRKVQALRDKAGLDLLCAFEHEFHYTGGDTTSAAGYNLRAHRKVNPFATKLIKNMREAGLKPDTFMPEYAPAQCEITMEPAYACRAADEASILREIVRTTADQFGEKASFTPLTTPGGVGNGVHIHMSLWDHESGLPVTHDHNAEHNLSKVALQFSAGVLRALPAIVALTAPSVISYQRLIPHRWSAPFNNLGFRDREAAIRICPGSSLGGQDPAKGTNLEFRAADATASPHLQLGVIVAAGLQGIMEELPSPVVTHEDLTCISAQNLTDLGIQRLPRSLTDALDNLEKMAKQDDRIQALFPQELLDVYLVHKRHEASMMRKLKDDQICKRYLAAY